MTKTYDIPETWEVMSKEDAASVVGEGIHTGLRKGTDAPEAPELWQAIRDSDQAWTDAIDYFLWGLEQMDLAICQRERGKDDRH